MKAKHTPGPWTAMKPGIYGDGICIARRHEQAGDEWEANARLIAAAPELLEACKAAMLSMEIEYGMPRHDGTKIIPARFTAAQINGDKTVSALRAIIAKAEGGAS